MLLSGLKPPMTTVVTGYRNSRPLLEPSMGLFAAKFATVGSRRNRESGYALSALSGAHITYYPVADRINPKTDLTPSAA